MAYIDRIEAAQPIDMAPSVHGTPLDQAGIYAAFGTLHVAARVLHSEVLDFDAVTGMRAPFQDKAGRTHTAELEYFNVLGFEGVTLVLPPVQAPIRTVYAATRSYGRRSHQAFTFRVPIDAELAAFPKHPDIVCAPMTDLDLASLTNVLKSCIAARQQPERVSQ